MNTAGLSTCSAWAYRSGVVYLLELGILLGYLGGGGLEHDNE
jgi:hypothetical protein